MIHTILNKVSYSAMIRAGIIFGLSCTIALTYNSLRRTGLPLLYIPSYPGSEASLSAQQAYSLYRQGKTLFIDTRYEEEYNQAHIRSALNIPGRYAIEKMMKHLDAIPKDELIVVYCGNVLCNSARRMAGFMKHSGFTSVYVFQDGFDSWLANGFPVQSGSR